MTSASPEPAVGERAIGGVANTASHDIWMADTFPSGRKFQALFESEDNTVFTPNNFVVTAVCAPNPAG